MTETNNIPDINELRKQINAVDEKLINLLAERRNLAAQVAEFKFHTGKAVKDYQRENELLINLTNLATEQNLNAPADLINTVYGSIISDSCNYQQELIIAKQDSFNLAKLNQVSIAYLGLPSSYSYLAANKFAGLIQKECTLTGAENFPSVLNAINRGQAQFGVLPLENTNSGSINEVYDLLSQTSLEIVADLSIDINHCFIAKDFISEKDIEVIYTHAQPYEQSIVRIRELNPSVKIEYVQSTTHAIQAVKESANPKAAAIGNAEAAQLYGLKVISDNIANNKNNKTRFIILSKNEIRYQESLPYKTMLQFITNNTEGSLLEALQVFKDSHVNLAKLESRPILGSPWREMFFVEFLGSIEQPNVQQALLNLQKVCNFTKLLGSFPSFSLVGETGK